MLRRLELGERVQVVYARKSKGRAALPPPAAFMPHHGKRGRVTATPGRARKAPRNYEIQLDSGGRIIVPRGNLRPISEGAKHK